MVKYCTHSDETNLYQGMLVTVLMGRVWPNPDFATNPDTSDRTTSLRKLIIVLHAMQTGLPHHSGTPVQLYKALLH